MEAMTTFSPAFLRAARSGTVSFLRSSGTEFGFLSALVERLHLPAYGIGVCGERRLVEIGARARLRIEVSVAVDATHEHRGVTHLRLPHIRRDVANRKADAPVVRPIGLRAVHELDVMERN